jgi:hypothetical protein
MGMVRSGPLLLGAPAWWRLGVPLLLLATTACQGSSSNSSAGVHDSGTEGADTGSSGHDAAGGPPEAGGDGGHPACNPDGGAAVESPCDASSDCLCPASCQGGFCAPGCTGNADCPTGSACVQSSCTFVECGPLATGGPNGNYGGVCNASGTNDGTCTPSADIGAGSSPMCPVGWICAPGGTSITMCSFGQTQPPAQTCIPGFLCYASGASSGTCTQSCGPSDGGACPPQGLVVCADGGDGG